MVGATLTKTTSLACRKEQPTSSKGINVLKLAEPLQTAWRGRDIYTLLARLEGQVYRDKEGRRTFQFELGGKSYFAKVFTGIGWKALLSCLLKFRKPIVSAENEKQAIETLPRIGIATMQLAGYGKRGINPARMQSFIITEELKPTVSLEDYCRDWRRHPPSPQWKRALIKRVAQITRTLHTNGIIHRDLYLCHFLLKTCPVPEISDSQPPRLYLIDLHRAEQRRRIQKRWRIKDVAGLYFSSMDIGLTRRDRLRFIEAYSHKPWREALQDQGTFWKQVQRRGDAGYRELQRKHPELFRETAH
jgi:heptose I phosphotransferase